jgi:hypothetical protein
LKNQLFKSVGAESRPLDFIGEIETTAPHLAGRLNSIPDMGTASAELENEIAAPAGPRNGDKSAKTKIASPITRRAALQRRLREIYRIGLAELAARHPGRPVVLFLEIPVPQGKAKWVAIGTGAKTLSRLMGHRDWRATQSFQTPYLADLLDWDSENMIGPKLLKAGAAFAIASLPAADAAAPVFTHELYAGGHA